VNGFIGADIAKQGESAELHLSFLSVCSIESEIRLTRQMKQTMTLAAQGNKIFFAIRSRLAPPDHVMDLELIAPATPLASPTIAHHNFRLELAITLAIEPKSTSWGSVPAHADRLILSRNSCCCGGGRKLKNRLSDPRRS
jgi:hypothetical protein